MSPAHADQDQRARCLAERIERMHDWLVKRADGKRFEVWVERNGRVVWSWERRCERAVSAGTFTNKVGLLDFRSAVHEAYDARRAA